MSGRRRPGSAGRRALKLRYCGGGLVAGEVVAGSVGRVGGVSPGTAVPSELAGGRVAGSVVGASTGAVAAESVAVSAAGSAVEPVSRSEQAVRETAPRAAAVVILMRMA